MEEKDISVLAVKTLALFDGVMWVIFGLALIFFFWALIKYGLSKSETERQQTIGIITNGIIILFAMVAVWGLVNLLFDFFGIELFRGDLQEVPRNPTDFIKK